MRPRARGNVAVAVVVFVLVVAGIVWASRAHRSGAVSQPIDLNARLMSEARLASTPVTTYTVSYRSITQDLSLTGTIQSPRTANVSAAAPGQVQSVFVSEGDPVSAGQILAQLNPAQAQAQAAQAQQQVQAAESAYQKALTGRLLTSQQANGDVTTAQIGLREALAGEAKAAAGAGASAIQQARDSARQGHAAAAEAAAALKRTRFLFEHAVVPASTLEEAQARKVVGSREAIADADVQAAFTQVASAREQLRVANLAVMYTRVVSPIAGVVSAVRSHTGEAAMPGEPLFVITSLGDVFFDTAVSEAEKLQLAAGQSATISLDALPGRNFNGRVSAVVPVQNPGSAGFEVRVSITPVSGAVIPPGAYARAVVRTGYSPRSLVVPIQAVLGVTPGPAQAGATVQPTQAGSTQFVYVVKSDPGSPSGSIAVKRPIVTGLSTAAEVQVVSGLAAGDEVVTGGAELLQGKASLPVTVETGSRAV
ncbi:MAG: efflux RND transporter periplasmic adaptor subunit [Chloroflexi bacterium]|nr:efflux RND transporter periplasmic adaptor subunit [Chloroflexota bacterium]